VTTMKKLIVLFFIFSAALAQAQKTRADSIIGKWKYMGASRSNAAYKMDASVYKEQLPTPKFEFVEFKKKGECTYNEKSGLAVHTVYKVNKHLLMLDGVEYEIRKVDGKNLMLYRSYYTVTGADGKIMRVDEEQLHFTRQK
jgi:hypothetical protein